MAEELMLFPYPPAEFLQKIRAMMEDVVDTKINHTIVIPEGLSEKTLLVPQEVCMILRISKPTLYALIKECRLKSFKIQSRRYFARTDIEEIIRRQGQSVRTTKPAD